MTPASNESIESARPTSAETIPLNHPGDLARPLSGSRSSLSRQRRQRAAVLDGSGRSSRTDILKLSQDSVLSSESTPHRLDPASRGAEQQTESRGYDSSYLDSTVSSSVSELATKNSQDSGYTTSRHHGKDRSQRNR